MSCEKTLFDEGNAKKHPKTLPVSKTKPTLSFALESKAKAQKNPFFPLLANESAPYYCLT